jgi:hypothetical protein
MKINAWLILFKTCKNKKKINREFFPGHNLTCFIQK